jgi:hypothetical protein
MNRGIQQNVRIDVQRLSSMPPDITPTALPPTAHLSSCKYWLAKHVYACARDDGAVILDARQDKYLGVEPQDARALEAVVNGWPPSSAGPLSSEDALPIAEQFASAGFLTGSAAEGRSAEPPSLSDRSTLIGVGDDADAHPLSTRDIARFLDAYRQVSWALRYRSFEAILQDAKESAKSSQPSRFDIALVSELLSIFRRMRGYTFAVRNRCLLHALLLTNFLTRYGQRPTWVIGVRTVPFAAHSWVQHAHFVLDTTPEKVCPYTPILAI